MNITHTDQKGQPVLESPAWDGSLLEASETQFRFNQQLRPTSL